MKTISIVTPMFNSMRTLDLYMQAIIMQDYPHDLMEIIIADGGSTDGTLERLKHYTGEVDFSVEIHPNPLRTAEAGKAVGVKNAKKEIVILLDSDNILPDSGWLSRMMEPFKEEKVIASEPIEYTYRKQDSVINRYCALIGMNDPLCMFTGNYDRFCCITKKWTEVQREEVDRGNYLSVRFYENMIPTIGANGFCMKREALLKNFSGEYLFDIDVLWSLFQKEPDLRVAKVKTGIVHLFCPDMNTFVRKQRRRIKDFLYYSEMQERKYPWNKIGKGKLVLFSLACVAVVPLLIQSIIGFHYKHDTRVWLLHPIACIVTLWVYGTGTIEGFFHKEEMDRSEWKQ